MRNIMILLLICCTGTAMAQGKVINDKNAEARKLSGSFTAIEVSHSIDLYLTQGNEEAVAVSAATTAIRDRIVVTVENGTLRIRIADTGSNWWRNTSNKKMKAYVSFKSLGKLVASGASDVIVEGGITVDKLQLNVSGASDFKGAVTARELDVRLSGASDVRISAGKVQELRIDASGASDFIGYSLEAVNCTAEASGASDIKVTVSNVLNARASGASGIRYRGTGVIKDLRSSGASSINRTEK